MNEQAAPVTAAAQRATDAQPGAGKARPTRAQRRRTGSLTRRMIIIAALWITPLLLIGGFALDRVLSRSIVDSFDNQLVFLLNSMIASSEIGPDGEVRFNRPPADQRFVEPYSGLYFQISGSRRATPSLRARSVGPAAARLDPTHADIKPHLYDSDEFSRAGHAEPLRDRRARRHSSGVEGSLAVPGRAIARDDQRPDPQAALRPCSGASLRLASDCSCWRRCRPSMACGRCGGCAARSLRSGREQ